MTNLSDTLAALKPCPFCGGDGRIAERPASGKDTGFFCAVSCFCGGYSARAHQHVIAETKEAARAEAIDAWNTRPDDRIEALEAENERLREALQSVTPPAYFGESEQRKVWWAKARAALGEKQ